MTPLPGAERRAAQRAIEQLIDNEAFLGAAIEGFAKAYNLDPTERDMLLGNLPVDKIVAELTTCMLDRFIKTSMALAFAKAIS